MRLFILYLILVASVSPVLAATYIVEKDGSGDFTVIQEAVDVAASGDTILVGSGHFSDGHLVTCTGWSNVVQVLIEQNELTILGSGVGNTIIGPDVPWTQGMEIDRGITGGPFFGSNDVHIEGISFVNSYGGIVSHAAFDLTVKSCSFSGHRYSILVGDGGRLIMDDCSFENVVGGGSAILSLSSDAAHISNCRFDFLSSDSVDVAAIHLEGVPVSTITNCEMLGGKNGAHYVGGAFGEIKNCAFVGQTQYGIVCSRSQNITISDSIFSEQRVAVYAKYAKVEMTSTSIIDVSNVSIGFYDHDDDLTVNNCILAHGPEFSIRQFRFCDKSEDDGLPHLDFTNNDWGTASVDSINAWIKVCDYVVDYIPYVGQPVAIERETWGGLKALYR